MTCFYILIIRIKITRVDIINHSTCQEFVAIIIMIASMDLTHKDVSGAQFLEVFSGQARTARLAEWSGYKSKAVDFLYSKSLDMLKPSGFMFLVSL